MQGAAEQWGQGAVVARPPQNLDLVGQKNGLSDLLHGLAGVHRELLDLAEGFRLLEPLRVHEDALGAFDELTGIEGFLEIGDMLIEFKELLVAGLAISIAGKSSASRKGLTT